MSKAVIADRVRLTVKASQSGDELTTPINALRTAECTRSSWPLCYAALAAAAGMAAGVAKQPADHQLLAIVNLVGRWHLVPFDAETVLTNTTGVWPAGVVGQLPVLQKPPRQDAPPPPPRPAWSFLAEYRSPRRSPPTLSEEAIDEPDFGWNEREYGFGIE
jgi:hypothetical protein